MDLGDRFVWVFTLGVYVSLERWLVKKRMNEGMFSCRFSASVVEYVAWLVHVA